MTTSLRLFLSMSYAVASTQASAQNIPEVNQSPTSTWSEYTIPLSQDDDSNVLLNFLTNPDGEIRDVQAAVKGFGDQLFWVPNGCTIITKSPLRLKCEVSGGGTPGNGPVLSTSEYIINIQPSLNEDNKSHSLILQGIDLGGLGRVPQILPPMEIQLPSE